MLEAGSEADLTLEALRAERGCKVHLQHLQGNRAIGFEIVGETDSSHTSSPHFTLELVAVAETFDELGGDVTHASGLRRGSFKCDRGVQGNRRPRDRAGNGGRSGGSSVTDGERSARTPL
jgi:hypothetical protein